MPQVPVLIGAGNGVRERDQLLRARRGSRDLAVGIDPRLDRAADGGNERGRAGVAPGTPDTPVGSSRLLTPHRNRQRRTYSLGLPCLQTEQLHQ